MTQKTKAANNVAFVTQAVLWLWKLHRILSEFSLNTAHAINFFNYDTHEHTLKIMLTIKHVEIKFLKVFEVLRTLAPPR